MSIGRYNLKSKQDQIRAKIDAQKEAARRELERRQAAKATVWVPEFRGAAKALQGLYGACFEAMISGPAETGKTFAACWLIDSLLRQYPNSQGVMLRQYRKDIVSTVLQTYEKISDKKGSVSRYGGKEPHWLDYSNGSRLWLAGLDDAGKALSSERDFIYVNQAESISLDAWETLTTRATGRAGNAPYGFMLGDCNPANDMHWIMQRSSLTVLKSYHKDNPTLFDDLGVPTEQGKRSLEILSNLSEPRRSRLFLGLWVSVEGQVYTEFDRNKHVASSAAYGPIPTAWPRIRVIDFGYKDPFVCTWFAINPESKQLIRYREIYHTGLLVEDAAKWIAELEGWEYDKRSGIKQWFRPMPERENIIATVCDHDAEDRATLERYGIPTIPATKYIKLGIEAVQSRLKGANGGILYLSDALVKADPELERMHLPLETLDEIEGYVWEEPKNGKKSKELPVDKLNHGLDTTRYAVAFVDDLGIELEPTVETVIAYDDYSISPI